MPRRRDPSSARSHTLRVAVRERDRDEFLAEARLRQISLSALLFSRLCASRPVSVTDARVAGELGRVGNLLNQITRRLNSGLTTSLTIDDLQPLIDIIRKLRLSLLGVDPGGAA